MRSQTSRELFRYWNSLRGSDPAPSRHSFEPANIGAILPNIFMLEMVGDIATMRLTGGDICALFGEELRGKSFARLWLNGVERRPSSIAAQCAEEQISFVIMADGLSTRGTVGKLEMLLLPLVSDGQKRDRIIGSLADLESNSPFLRKHIKGMSLTAIRQLDGDTIPVNFAENKANQVTRINFAQSEEHKKVGHLFVIDGGVKN